MTLPTFLGIGVPRGGSTWLHALLAGHRDVFMPTRRKEIRFFDTHFERGVPWYEAFFCPEEDRPRYGAVGEISPQYLYDPRCPERIEATLPGVRLIVMLRHPVSRAYSHYGFVVQRRNYRGSFEDFLASRPRALEMGHYARHLDVYARRFGSERMLVLASEDAFSDRGGTQDRLADFLGIARDGFAAAEGGERVNASTVPRSGPLAGAVVTAARRLRRHGLEPAVDAAARLGLTRVLFQGSGLPRLDADVKRELSRSYEPEYAQIEERFGVDLNVWRT